MQEQKESPKKKTQDIYTLLNHTWICQAVYVVTKLGIPDWIARHPQTIESLAAACDAEPMPLFQVMRALASFDIVEFLPDGRVGLAAKGNLLRANVAFSLRSYVLLWGEQLYAAGGKMLDQVKTGTTGFELEFGESIWATYSRNPEAQKCFDEFMGDATKSHMLAIPTFFPFRRFRKVVDVGAGSGALLAAVLKQNPHLTGVWYDRSEMLGAARARCQHAGVADRCEFVAGNFLQSVPGDADLYVIKHVLHDWDDEMASRILGNVEAAMSDDATLVIVEGVTDAATEAAELLLKCRDLEQMMWTGGRARSCDDFEELLSPNGLKLNRLIRTPILDVTLIEVVKSPRVAGLLQPRIA